jgi:hypothetical protein
MTNDPQDNVDVPADDELADELLGDVSGAGHIGIMGGNGGNGGNG